MLRHFAYEVPVDRLVEMPHANLLFAHDHSPETSGRSAALHGGHIGSILLKNVGEDRIKGPVKRLFI
ncbi:MAG: hypothetical protein AAF191_01290, partial [Verrucomicrobiota bacterium]